MTGDVREKIAKNRAVHKPIEQIRSERYNAHQRKFSGRGKLKRNQQKRPEAAKNIEAQKQPPRSVDILST